MPRFEFEISIALVVCVAASCIILWFTREKEGKVALPTNIGDEPVGDGFIGGGDPFDVTRPEDIVDGLPIDEDEFWRRVSSSGFLWFLGKTLNCCICLDAVAEDGHVDTSRFRCGYQCF